MSYIRVIPRDLFNEANLLKCYAQIYINLEHLNAPGVFLDHFNGNDPFDVQLNEDDGSLRIDNVELVVRGERMALMRPMNSREPWPLYMTTADDEVIEVFDNVGNFTTEMLEFLAPSGEAE